MNEAPEHFRLKRSCWKRALKIFGILGLLLVIALLIWMRGAIYNRFVRYPREESAWNQLRAKAMPVTNDAGWREFRGTLHSHSHLSHDSEVTFDEILQVLKKDRLDFICLSDHCDGGLADFNAQWRGLHDGKLFIPGYEMRKGFMPFGVASGTVLSNATDSPTLARQITDHGGLLFFAHPEEERDWELPELVGMEIYNIHVDFKRSRHRESDLLPDLVLNHRRYPEHIVYSVFRRPADFLQLWDQLNENRHITGIAANDCHQNVGFRGICTSNNTVKIEDTSPKTLSEIRLNVLTRPVARILFGPLEPGRKLFHFQLDPYDRMARFVNTHVLARDLDEGSILESLKAGRVFVGFDLIADSSGFRFFASGNGTPPRVMGEACAYSEALKLHALSPLPCRFTLRRNGAVMFQEQDYALEWHPPQPGKYRVEAEVRFGGNWVPWVYANPIELSERPLTAE